MGLGNFCSVVLLVCSLAIKRQRDFRKLEIISLFYQRALTFSLFFNFLDLLFFSIEWSAFAHTFVTDSEGSRLKMKSIIMRKFWCW